jgi:hypothetical protein
MMPASEVLGFIRLVRGCGIAAEILLLAKDCSEKPGQKPPFIVRMRAPDSFYNND